MDGKFNERRSLHGVLGGCFSGCDELSSVPFACSGERKARRIVQLRGNSRTKSSLSFKIEKKKRSVERVIVKVK